MHATLENAVAQGQWPYHAGGPHAAEPAALACLALASQRSSAARAPAEWLAQMQTAEGAVGVVDGIEQPAWTTSLAILAWTAMARFAGDKRFRPNVVASIDWSLRTKGRTSPRQPQIGHDSTIAGWSWAADTHSWIEPTAMFVLALRAAGMASHPRTRDGERMLVDRLLPEGGCNYGNTVVLGQTLLQHIQPTGLALAALAGSDERDPRIAASLDYLARELNGKTPTASLCFGIVGLAAHNRRPADAGKWLAAATDREQGDNPSVYKLALLALAGDANLRWLAGEHGGRTTATAHVPHPIAAPYLAHHTVLQ